MTHLFILVQWQNSAELRGENKAETVIFEKSEIFFVSESVQISQLNHLP